VSPFSGSKSERCEHNTEDALVFAFQPDRLIVVIIYTQSTLIPHRIAMTGAKDRYYVYNRNVYYRNYDRLVV